MLDGCKQPLHVSTLASCMILTYIDVQFSIQQLVIVSRLRDSHDMGKSAEATIQEAHLGWTT